MKNFILVCVSFGVVIGLTGFVSSIVGPIDKIYKVVMSTILVILVFASIVVTSMLKADWNIDKNQFVMSGLLEVVIMLAVYLITTKLIYKR